MGDGFYLDQHFRLCKGSHFYQRGSWKISGKELAARSPDLGIVLDIDYVDRHLDQVIHRTTGGFDDAINARKYLLGLFVLIFPDYLRTALKRTGYLPGDEQHVACVYRV